MFLLFFQEFIDDWVWERDGNGTKDMGWKPALRSEFGFFCLSGKVCISGGWFSFAHSLWTACINELYEPFFTLIIFFPTLVVQDRDMCLKRVLQCDTPSRTDTCSEIIVLPYRYL